MAHNNQPLSSIEALSQAAHDVLGGQNPGQAEGSQHFNFDAGTQVHSSKQFPGTSYPSVNDSNLHAIPVDASGAFMHNLNQNVGQYQQLDSEDVKPDQLPSWTDRRNSHTSMEDHGGSFTGADQQSTRQQSDGFDVKTALGAINDPSTSFNDHAHMDSTPGQSTTDPDSVDRNEAVAPSWTDLKTKAGKERKRLPLACIACRRKKIRCSGEKPACKHCLRSRIPCVYKITTRKATPRTDYMAMLDKRLKRMEERIIKAVPKSKESAMEMLERASLKPADYKGPGLKSLHSRKRSAKEAFTENLEQWTREAPTNTDAQLAAAVPRHEGSEHSLTTAGAQSLPPIEIQEYLVEIFFDYVYGQAYHLLHKPTIVRKMKTGTAPPVLILAICAIAARFAEHPEISDDPPFLRGEQWASEARNIAVSWYDEPNITILTVLIILGLHEFGCCRGGRSWMFGGMAIRMAIALQLHKELDDDPLGQNGNGEMSFTDREVRRRLMWSCFLMDRFNSSGTGRPMFVSEDTIKIQLPIREDFFEMGILGPTESLDGPVPNPLGLTLGSMSDPSQNTGVAGYVLRVIVFWGRVIQYFNLGEKEKDPQPLWDLRSQFAAFKRQIEQFRGNLPENLLYNERNLQTHASQRIANQFLFLHISLHQVILFMHRFAIPAGPGVPLPQDMPKDFVTQCSRSAVEAASQISNLIRDSKGYRVVAPFVGYCAYLSSTVHIFGLFQRNTQLRQVSKRNLETNIAYLMQTKKYWGVFHYMTNNLKEIYHQYDGTAQKSQQAVGSSQLSPSGALQYGDWFDRYPRGVSKSSDNTPTPQPSDEKQPEVLSHDGSDLQNIDKLFAAASPPTTESKKSQKRPNVRRVALRTASDQDASKASHGDNKSSTGKSRKSDSSKLGRQPRRASEPMAITSPTEAPVIGPQTFAENSQDAFNPAFPMPDAPVIFPQEQPQQPPGSDHSQQQNVASFSSPLPHNSLNQFPSTLQDMSSLQQQGMLPQLDRQLVYGGYVGLEPSDMAPASIVLGAGTSSGLCQDIACTSASTHPHPPHTHQNQLQHQHQYQPQQQPWQTSGEGQGVLGAGTNVSNAGNGGYGFPSTGGGGGMDPRMDLTTNSAWFIPFNTEPPWNGQ